MEKWEAELTAGRQTLAEMKIQRSIFLGDSFSPLLFVMAMMSLTHILRRCIGGYKFTKSYDEVNHLMYMDDIKIFTKSEKELETVIHTIKIYSQDIGMEYVIEKMYHVDNEKLEKRNNGRNRITKSGRHQNTWGKRKLKVLVNMGS